jgi:hypothetical protein
MIPEDGTPPKSGLYVAYVNTDMTRRWAERILLSWDGRWYYPGSGQAYRAHVYQWLGPLPALELED